MMVNGRDSMSKMRQDDQLSSTADKAFTKPNSSRLLNVANDEFLVLSMLAGNRHREK